MHFEQNIRDEQRFFFEEKEDLFRTTQIYQPLAQPAENYDFSYNPFLKAQYLWRQEEV